MAPATGRQRTVKEEAEKALAEEASLLLSDLGETLNRPEPVTLHLYARMRIKCMQVDGCYQSDAHILWLCLVTACWKAKRQRFSCLSFPSSILLAVFKYLYTGKPDPPLSWKMGLEVISAAHYFTISPIEIIAQGYLWSEVSKVDKELQSDVVMVMLSEALEFHKAWEGKEEMLLELTVSLCMRWFQGEESARKLSENAMDYILSKRKSHGKRECEKQSNSMVEYYSFRQAVLWQAYQKFSSPDAEAQQYLQKALPDWPSLSITSLQPTLKDKEFDCSRYNRFDLHGPTAVLNCRLGIDIQKESFQRLLDYTDWCRIPAHLLLEVVYPLGLIPSHFLIAVLAFHAFSRPVETLAHVLNVWKHSTSGMVSSISNGQIIFKDNRGYHGIGHAMASLPMRQTGGMYQWQFEIQERKATSIFLGFVCGRKDRNWEQSGWQQTNICIIVLGQDYCTSTSHRDAHLSPRIPQQGLGRIGR